MRGEKTPVGLARVYRHLLYSSLNAFGMVLDWRLTVFFFYLSVYFLHFQANQKGDPVAMLKKQLEERERQLAAEQEDVSAAKNRLRELTKVSHTTVTACSHGNPVRLLFLIKSKETKLLNG